MRGKRVRVLVALGMSVLSALSLSPPVAASDVHSVTAELHRGRIDLVGAAGTINTDYPGSGVGECEGSFEIDADLDYKTRTMELTGFTYKVPFVLPIFGGNYQAEATGIERSGPATWDHDGDHTWGPVTERIDFEIQEFDAAQCIKGETVCDGTIEMEFNGETRNARDTFPDIYVRGTTTEEIAIREPCDFLWTFLLDGASARIEQVPGSGDPDAWFRRI